MATKPLPSPELLRQLLRYEAETGKLFWKERSPEQFIGTVRRRNADCLAWNRQFAGKEAFLNHSNGYLVGTIKNRGMRAHRVIWAICHGQWPDSIIDHLNQNKMDNRLCNLRLSNHTENARNAKLSARNKSGATGVSWYDKLGKWCVTIRRDGRNRHLGYFEKFDEAKAARKTAEEEIGFSHLHGQRRNLSN